MNWVTKYLEAIQSHEEIVGTKIRAMYEREAGWIQNPPSDFPYYFDEDVGQRPIAFIETYCKHSKGRWGRLPIRLELFQKAKIQLAFGWLEKSTHKRRFREVVDIRGRKCGKSTETAAIALYMTVADGESGAENYAVANKLDQAKIIFSEVVNMRAQSPALNNPRVTKKRQSDIYFPATFSSIKAIASDTSTMDGLNAHFFSLDEFHEARDSKVYDVMVQSQAAREQPLAWLISTNGFVREAFFDTKYSYCAKVAAWEDGFHDYRLLPLIFELDSREEWTDPKCWAKANPGIGKIKSLSTLSENVEKAKRDPTFLPTVLTKDFNVPEVTASAAMTYEAAVNNTVVPMEYLRDTYAIGGCDLSAVRDLTAATLLIRRPNDDNFYVLQKCFLPMGRIDALESTNNREAPYRLWEQQGWLEICPGATVDFRAVTSWFLSMLNQYKINTLWTGYDRALAGYWVEEMTESGYDMERIAQGPITWTYPFKRIIGLFEEHKIIYQNSPMLRWACLNVGIKTLNKDGIQSIQPVKVSESKRIDPFVSLLNAFTCYCNHETEYMNYVR